MNSKIKKILPYRVRNDYRGLMKPKSSETTNLTTRKTNPKAKVVSGHGVTEYSTCDRGASGSVSYVEIVRGDAERER